MTRRIVGLSDAEWEGVDELQNRIANHIEEKFGVTVGEYDFVDKAVYVTEGGNREWTRIEFKIEYQGRQLQLRAWLYNITWRRNNDRGEEYKWRYLWKLADRVTYNVIDHFFDDSIALTHNSKGQWLGK